MNNINLKFDKERQMLYGPFLIPNMLIYRSDEVNGEYYVRFSKEEIEKIATKFNEDLNSKNINLMHTDEKVEAFVAQSWIIESDQDKSKSLGFDLPEGTWFGAVKVKDTQFWMEKVKSEEVKGFSVEILADLELALKNKEEKMKENLKLASATLKDGVMVWYDGDLTIGSAIFMDEAMTEAAPDTNHELENGVVVVTVNGLVTEIIEAAVENEEENLEVEPNGNTTQITPEEVSQMIDARFAELMEEITRLKTLVDGQTEEFNKTINEKFKTTPAVESVKKSNVEERFKKDEERIKSFMRAK